MALLVGTTTGRREYKQLQVYDRRGKNPIYIESKVSRGEGKEKKMPPRSKTIGFFVVNGKCGFCGLVVGSEKFPMFGMYERIDSSLATASRSKFTAYKLESMEQVESKWRDVELAVTEGTLIPERWLQHKQPWAFEEAYAAVKEEEKREMKRNTRQATRAEGEEAEENMDENTQEEELEQREQENGVGRGKRIVKLTPKGKEQGQQKAKKDNPVKKEKKKQEREEGKGRQGQKREEQPEMCATCGKTADQHKETEMIEGTYAQNGRCKNVCNQGFQDSPCGHATNASM